MGFLWPKKPHSWPLLIYSSIAVSIFFLSQIKIWMEIRIMGWLIRWLKTWVGFMWSKPCFLTIAYPFLHCSELVFLPQNQDLSGNEEYGMTHKMKKDLNCAPEARKLSSQRLEGNQLPLGCLSPVSNAWLTLPSAIGLHLSSPPSPPPAHTGL